MSLVLSVIAIVDAIITATAITTATGMGTAVIAERTPEMRQRTMAAFDEHCSDCERLLGDRCEAVNRWMDEEFSKYGANHRFVRHHWRGVREARELFGGVVVHILKDCGRVPQAREWNETKMVDSPLIIHPKDGLMGFWSSPEEFDEAAKQSLKRMEPCD